MNVAPNEPVLVRRDDGRIAILTLNRPHAMNALSGELIDALKAEFDRLAQDKNIRCVIVEARGRAFSTGHDLREVASSRDYAFHHDLLTRCSAMMMAIRDLPQPVIAKVQAVATAAGCQLVAACDLAVASSDATFATSGINNGLFCGTPSVSVGRNVGSKRALEMLFTGQSIDAATAREIQDKYLRRSFDEVYRETRDFYAKEAPEEIERAERNPKARMALVFRWYFIHTMRLAMEGKAEHRVDYQVHTGPALGAFNQWVKGTLLEDWRHRHVDAIGAHLMQACADYVDRRIRALS